MKPPHVVMPMPIAPHPRFRYLYLFFVGLFLCLMPLWGQEDPTEAQGDPGDQSGPPIARPIPPREETAPLIELRGVKQTDYIESASPTQRENRYLNNRSFTSGAESLLAPAFLDRPIEISQATEDNGLSYNEVEFSLGPFNAFNAEALLTRLFNKTAITLDIDFRYTSALGQLTTNGYLDIDNSELTQFNFLQRLSFNHNTHILDFRHFLQVEGLQGLNLTEGILESPSSSSPEPPTASDPSDPPASEQLEHSLFVNALHYSFNLPLSASRVENLTLLGSFLIHYHNQSVSSAADANVPEDDLVYGLFEEDNYIALSFNKNIQHYLEFSFGTTLGTFVDERTFEFITSSFSTYRYTQQAGTFFIELGVGYVYRAEREIDPVSSNPAEPSSDSHFPILPKVILGFTLSEMLSLTFASEGLAERATSENFFISYTPLPFNNQVFPPLNRILEQSVTLSVSVEESLTWDIGLIHDLYLNDIERIALRSNGTAFKERLPASLDDPTSTISLRSDLKVSFLPFFSLTQNTEYTLPEDNDLAPTLTFQTGLSFSETLFHSTLSFRHFYSYEDFLVVHAASSDTPTEQARIDRNELQLRYEIFLSDKETQKISIFLELTNLINTSNYRSIPYLLSPTRQIEVGLHYIF